MKYKPVTSHDDETDTIEFKDSVLNIALMSPEDKAKSLYYALLRRNYRTINVHAAAFQAPPYMMDRVMSLEDSTKLIDDWLENNNFKRPTKEVAIEFVGDVLGKVLD